MEYLDGLEVSTTRDREGRIAGINIDVLDGGNAIFFGTYDHNGNPKRLKTIKYEGEKPVSAVSKYFGSKWEVCEIWTTLFDSAGRVAETFGLKPDGSPLGDGHYAFRYDEEGREQQVFSFDDVGSPNTPGRSRRYVYRSDEQGNWVERIEYRPETKSDRAQTSVATREITYHD